MIMVSVNLEQANALKVQEMQSAMESMLKVCKSGSIPPAMLKKAAGVSEDVSKWIVKQFAEESDSADDTASRAAAQLQRRVARQQLKVLGNLQVSTEDLASWDFNALEQSEDMLVSYVVSMFEDLQMISSFGLSRKNLKIWIALVRQKYRGNPFHNWAHAVTVLHTTYLLLREIGVDRFTDVEILAAMLAALSHDVDHDGVNNAFHINSQSELALTFNDQSVMENHHGRVGFQLLLESKLLQPLEAADFKIVRKLFVEMILSTDMAQHSKKITDLQRLTEPFNADTLTADQRALILTLIMHTADLYTPLKKFDISHQWASRLKTEFADQVKRGEGRGRRRGREDLWVFVVVSLLWLWLSGLCGFGFHHP